MKSPLFSDIAASLLILLFGYTALTKAFSNASFRAVLEPTMNRTGAAVTAFLLPTLEAVIVLLLFLPRTRLKGLYLSALSLGVFTVYLLYMVLAVPHLPCRCGGVISGMSWGVHIPFNLVFLALTLAAIRALRKTPSPTPGTAATTGTTP